MKIALVSPYDHSVSGGVGTHIDGLDREFRALGHSVKILAPASDVSHLADNVMVVSDHVVPVGISGSKARITLSFSVYRNVKRILKEEQFDVVHIHEPLVPTLPIFVLRHTQGVTIGTFHAYRDSYVGYDYTKVILRRLMHRLDARTVVSAAVLPYITRYFPGEYHIVPNGIDPARFSSPDLKPIEKFDDGKLNILFLGRLDKRKGFRYLLAAFRQIKAVIPEARLLVAGAFDRDDKKKYVRYARKYGLRDVKFIGFVSNEDLPRYYHSAHVFCAPSTGFESFGLVLLEAMASGVPIVASDIPGYRQVVTHGHEGLLVPAKDEVALAEAIIALLRSPEQRARLAANGQRTAEQYSWKSIAQRTLDIYHHCLEYRRLHPPEKDNFHFYMTRDELRQFLRL